MAEQSETQQPYSHQALTGIRILDFTQVLAGPFATQQLAQLGADVIKVEQPGVGDITRGGLVSGDSPGMAPSFLTCNIGKRSLGLDLKSPEAKEIIFKIIETCDAVVENFKPGTIERLGFGYEAVKAVKPDIVYASISGYGQSGPKSELPAFDGAIQAASGMMSITGHPESGPTRTGFFSVDMSTALNAAFAITASLFRRAQTGQGQRVDVAMLDTALAMQAPQMTAYQMAGTMQDLLGNRSPTKQPTANVFTTSDGHVQVVALKNSQIQALLKALGEEDFFTGFEEAAERVRGTDAWNALLVPLFQAETSAHWLALLAEAGVPAAPIRDHAQTAADEQLEHRLIFAEIPSPSGEGEVKVVSASHMTSPAPPTVQRPAPTIGQHNEELLAEFGYSAEAIDGLTASGAIGT